MFASAGLIQKQGARTQRLLWASTGTKDPRYPDTYYVDALVGADTGLRAAWEALSPSRRREAAEHIASAKLDATRARRLEELVASLR